MFSLEDIATSNKVKWVMLLVIMVAVIILAVLFSVQFFVKLDAKTLDSMSSVRNATLQQTSAQSTRFATEGPSGSQTELTPYEARMLQTSKSSYADSLVGSRQDPLFMTRDDDLSKQLVSRARMSETNEQVQPKEGLENVRVRPLQGGERATEGQLALSLGRGF